MFTCWMTEAGAVGRGAASAASKEAEECGGEAMGGVEAEVSDGYQDWMPGLLIPCRRQALARERE